MVQRWVSHRELRLIVYCCHLLTEPDQTCKDFLILFFFFVFFRWKYKTNPVVLNCQIKFLYSKHYRHKTKYIKKAKTRKTLSAFWYRDSLGRLWIWSALNNWRQIWFKYFFSSFFWRFLCVFFYHQPTTTNPLFSLDVGLLAGTSILSILLAIRKNTLYWQTVCPHSLFDSHAGSGSIRSLLCCVVLCLFFHSLLCSGSLLTPFFSECAIISTNSYKYDGRTECSV